MKKFFLFIMTIVTIGLFFFIRTILGCSISDKEAIAIAKDFCTKVNISFSQEPQVLDSHYIWLMLNAKVKDIAFGERGNTEKEIRVSCDKRQVVDFFDWAISRHVRKKYKVSSVTTEPHNWPPFLSESKAKETIFSVADKIGLPSDVEFSKLLLFKDEGIWKGWWIRKHNGYSYEDDRIEISIMAVDGELFIYGKTFRGKPCPTGVKINKVEATEEGWIHIKRIFPAVDWNKYQQAYKIKSAELKIVQPNVLAGKIIPWFSTKSRLAWKIIYELEPSGQDRLSAPEFKQQIIIKIDAATKKFLGGDYTQ